MPADRRARAIMKLPSVDTRMRNSQDLAVLAYTSLAAAVARTGVGRDEAGVEVERVSVCQLTPTAFSSRRMSGEVGNAREAGHEEVGRGEFWRQRCLARSR